VALFWRFDVQEEAKKQMLTRIDTDKTKDD
jgi:hypothetical protein